MIEGVRQAPYVAINKRLGRRYVWINCSDCLSQQPETVRAGLRCGYMPADKWTGDGKASYVPGSPVAPPSICPGYSIQHRKVSEVANAWGWWKRGQLQLLYDEVPDVLSDMIGMFNESVAGADHYMIEETK